MSRRKRWVRAMTAWELGWQAGLTRRAITALFWVTPDKAIGAQQEKVKRGLQEDRRETFPYISLLTYGEVYVLLLLMKTTQINDAVSFSVKGQVVIPRRLRKEFCIEEGTRALVYREDDHIVLMPMSAKRYNALQGCLKGTGVMKVFMDERKRERELQNGRQGVG